MEHIKNVNELNTIEAVDDYIGELLDEIHDLKQEIEELKDDKNYFEERCRQEGVY